MKITDRIYTYPEKGMLDCNTYVIKDDLLVMIDTGLTDYLPDRLEEMARDGLDPKKIALIVNTHLHGDHCWANQSLKESSGAKINLHPLQTKYYDLNVRQMARFFGIEPVEFSADGALETRLETGKLSFELITAPGHSPDSVCFYCREEKVLICGDVVFDHNTGRVDLPGGNGQQLKESIEALAKLDIEYVMPGHMGIVEGREAVKSNFEFVRRNVFPAL
ncbi:MAG: zn-dependent hydrolase, including glyoxylase [Dehalococcoidia bacterium]|nr:zn-dependent hydrolase, including glyoxylase [Dehalococcoidia bacterium]